MGELSRLFDPDRVAVVGATERSGSVEAAITRNLVVSFDGEVVPVNPNAESVFGLEAFDSVRDAAVDRLQQDAIPFLEDRGCPVLDVLPHERGLAGVTTDELAAELGAERLTDGPSDAFVERFLVGAMSGEEALRHFRRTRNAAVITGGDRPEIHTAAIEAPGVEVLVVTGSRRPTGAVLGKAEAAGTTVLAVTTDTLRTVERAEEIVSYAETSGIGLVVMGTHGQSGLARRLLGSVTERVVRTSPMPILTMRLGESDVTVESGEHAVSIAEEALDASGYTDVTVDDAAERQRSVWVVYGERGADEFLVYVDPVTQRAEVLQR